MPSELPNKETLSDCVAHSLHQQKNGTIEAGVSKRGVRVQLSEIMAEDERTAVRATGYAVLSIHSVVSTLIDFVQVWQGLQAPFYGEHTLIEDERLVCRRHVTSCNCG